MLVERQGDVQVIDPLPLRDIADFGERAEERKTAIPDVIAARPIVHETDDLISELAMLQDSIRDHPSKIPRAGNQDSLETDAGAPPMLEQGAHQPTRTVREQHVAGQEHSPDELRNLVRAVRLVDIGDVIGLDVQRRADAEDNREDAADEDGEEIVHARSAATEPVYALKLKGDRRQHRDEWRHVEILLDGRIPLGHRNQAALEADTECQHESPDGQQRVAHDVERDEEAVVSLYHRRSAGAL